MLYVFMPNFMSKNHFNIFYIHLKDRRDSQAKHRKTALALERILILYLVRYFPTMILLDEKEILLILLNLPRISLLLVLILLILLRNYPFLPSFFI